MAAILKFEENKPETIALMFSEGKNVIDGYQHEKVMFTLVDQRLMFVTPDVANRIRLLDVAIEYILNSDPFRVDLSVIRNEYEPPEPGAAA